MCALVYKLFLLSLMGSSVLSQMMQQLQMQQLQRVNALQQATLNSLQNRGLPNVVVRPNNNIASQMLQTNTNFGTNNGFRIPMNPAQFGGNTNNNNMNNNLLPVNVLLQQQQNLQSQVLQNMLNAQRNFMTNSNSLNRNSNSNQFTNTQTSNQNTLRRNVPAVNSRTSDNINIVVRNGNQNPSNSGTGSSSFQSPTTTASPGSSRSVFTNPFLTSVINSNNGSTGSIFSGFGSPFTFPSSSGSFWTGSSTTNNQQTTSSPISGNSNSFQSATGNVITSGPSSSQGISNTVFPSSFGSFGNFQSSFSNNANSGSTANNGRSSGSMSPSTVTVVTSPSSSRITTVQSQPALTCTDEYRRKPGHTLCMTDNKGLGKHGVAIDDKLMITQYHNNLRASVQPPASDLLKLQWDERLAAVAEKWAKQCTLAHDKERSIGDLGMSIGQNVAVGYETWQQAMQQWYDEIKLYRYGFDPDSYLGPDGWKEIAHFTQIVQNGTYLIGCGYAECPNTEYIRYYVCDYAAGQTDLAYPYTAGARCGSCPNSCVNGLCDCGDLVCVNKGELDPTTCSCKCPKPYKGRTCEITDCPVEDNWICGRDWPPSYCDTYSNVPEECPYMCGICSDGRTTSPLNPTVPVAKNLTFVSTYGCRYTGIRDDSATCSKYGDRGMDKKVCTSQGGTVGCGECERYFNIKRDYCPVMCGLCDPPCAGKVCMNGGTLDSQSCTCNCRKPFTGDVCELAQCPVSGDPAFCRFWPLRYCTLYYNVPEECPYKCGICKDSSPAVTISNNNNNNKRSRGSVTVETREALT